MSGSRKGGWPRRAVRFYAACGAVLLTLFFAWMVIGLPLFFDRMCIRSEAPTEAEYIVCLGNGLTTGNLPTEEGWNRIYTAVQLYLDGYGRKIIFTGGGAERISETEVYAEAARWLGLDPADAVFEPGANGTSDHPAKILLIDGEKVEKSTALNIVTSPLHSKRAALCFQKAGFTGFRMVTGYRASGKRTAVVIEPSPEAGEPPVRREIVVSKANAGEFLRDRKTSKLPAYRPSGKAYRDIFIKLKARTGYFFTALRELAALGAYKIKGYV